MNKISLSFAFFLFTSLLVFGQNKELIWQEEFNGTTLNEDVWNYELGDGCPQLCGWGNNERQKYTTTNHTVQNGYLHIRAKLEDGLYTSTRITTKDKFEFRYGRIEARAKLPVGKGLWPAFWMLGANISEVGWPASGEIDILEYVGKEPGKVFSTLHTPASHGMSVNTKKQQIEDIEVGFHVFAANWTPDKIEFFVDNDLIYTFSPKTKTKEVWPFDQPFYMILNMAIGGAFGGPEVNDSIFPQDFIIDHIKVYKN